MLVQSHFFIAKEITKKTREGLNHGYFYLGNIAPDFIPPHTKKEHAFKSSFSYISNEIKLIETLRDINTISFKLGIITHYLADYFCQAHNSELLVKNLWQHFQYESMLHSLLISSNNKVKVKENVYDIEAFIKEKYDNYLLENASVVVDILYALEVCQAVVCYILQKTNKDILTAA